MGQERPVTSDSDYRSQIMEEAEVEAILSEKAKEPILPLTQTPEMEAEAEEAEEGEILETLEEGEILETLEEGEILETLEEGEIPRILMQQEQHPRILIPIESAIN